MFEPPLLVQDLVRQEPDQDQDQDHNSDAPEDVFGSSILTLFDELPPMYSSSSGTTSVGGVHVASPQPNRWDLQAHGVWRSAVKLVESIEEVGKRYLSSCLSGDILELGACAGLSGLAVFKMFSPRRLTLSDYPDPDILSTLRQNRDQNVGPELIDSVDVWGHAWGTCASSACTATLESSQRRYDLILAADVLWVSDQHSHLITCLHQHLRRSSQSAVFLVCGLHTGRGTIARFIVAVKESGFEMRLLRETRFVPFEGGQTTQREWQGEREGESKAEMAFWAVEIVLGFPTT